MKLVSWMIISILMGMNAYGFIPIKTNSGLSTHWPNININFRTNEVNSSGLAANDIFTIFTNSLNRWKTSAANAFNFSYYQGSDRSRYPTLPGQTADSTIFFTSQTSSGFQIQCGIIAVTQVYFDQGNGQINKAELRFNDNCYHFTNSPSDTGVGTKIYLGDVATHELGHAFGLDHSQNELSTMVYAASIEMSKPGCDDHAAMNTIYNPGGSQFSKISGTILNPQGGAQFGAHVQAISLERGVALASALTDKNGSFQLSGLETGHYSILVEPYYPGSSTLGPYYQGIQSNTCNGSNFDRTFYSSNGKLLQIDLTNSGVNIDVGQLNVSCTAPNSINQSLENNFNTAPTLISSSVQSAIATEGVFSNSSADGYYYLKNQIGNLTAVAMSYTLGSSADVEVEFLNSLGQRLTQNANTNRMISATSGYINFDSDSSIQLNSMQDIIVHVRKVGTIPTYRFPAQSVGVSNTQYYVLSVSQSSNQNLYASNSRCQAADNFGPYAKLGDPPPATFGQNQNATKPSGCGLLGTMKNQEKIEIKNEGKFYEIKNLNPRALNFAFLFTMLFLVKKIIRRKQINVPT